MTEKTNLAYINDVAAREVSVERSSVTYKNIAGFEIAINNDVDQTHERLRSSFAIDADIVKKKLEKAQIEPLAIIPTSWWNKIVEDSGMLNIHPNGNSEVYVNAKEVASDTAHGNIPLIGFAGWMMLCTVGTYFVGTQFLVVNVWTIIGGLFAAFCFGTASYAILANSLFQWINVKLYLHLTSKKKVYDSMVTKDSFSNSVQVSFPIPPDDVAKILIKARENSLDLHIATVGEAVAFNPSFEKIIHAQLNKDRAEREERRRQLDAMLDPIVFIEYGSAVGIIAQFGDFPIEKAIVDQVMSSKI